EICEEHETETKPGPISRTEFLATRPAGDQTDHAADPELRKTAQDDWTVEAARLRRATKIWQMKVHQLQNKLESPLFLMKAAFANMWRMPRELLLAKQAERRRRHDIDAIRFSGLFDDEWYLVQNPDVASQRLEPIRHYVEYGAHEGRDPSRYF